MAELNFTEAQQDAIYAHGGSIIVSAAAGSGKTRVLVQRVIEMLTDKENPVSADRLLIVTFTNAAASEMKSRIITALEQCILEDPENDFLRNQRRLLPHADICTIHSFCSRIVRNNFYILNIGRDFRIASEGEFKVLKENILSDLLDEYYTQKDSDFLAFAENLSNSKNDNALSEIIISIYDYTMSHPFPKQWIEQAIEHYQTKEPLSNTVYGDAVFSMLPQELDFISSILMRYQKIAETIGMLDLSLDDKLQISVQTVQILLQKLQTLHTRLISVPEPSWNDLVNSFEELKEITIKQPNKPREKPDDETNTLIRTYFEQLSALKSFVKDFFEDKSTKIFSIREEQYHSDNQKLLPALMGMRKLLFDFMERYTEQKHQKNILDFNDLEHLLLQLLVTPAENEKGYERTAFAQQLSEQYDEIMVDEYQDSNNAQEMIFNALSKDNTNCFVVGDVKQSIYRFREAVPENFIRRRTHSTLYNRTTPQFPARIVLDRNFRSRKGITDSVNYVFEQLMSESVGDIDYNDEEKLVAAAQYPPADFPDAELHIVLNTVSSDETEDRSNDQAEGKYIAELIEDMMKTATVTENGIQRPVRYNDFCILMRNMSSHAAEYAEQLEKKGIPSFINRGIGLFSCYEVRVATAFLKLVDNPLQDIPLLSVLMHPIFAFSPDDLAKVRIECPHKYLFSSLKQLSCKNDFSPEQKEEIILQEKCKHFLSEFDFYRRLSVTLPTDQLLSVFFERSGFVAFISAMKGGQGRVKNINKFLTCVREYEGENFKGLTGFVRYLNRLEETGNELTASDTAPTDSVKIMSIHHSKGLEFPICILATTNSKGNTRADAIVHHAKLGLGLMSVDSKRAFKASTLQRNIISETLHREDISEELRVLYVAMTRAKERLIMVSTFTYNKESSKNAFTKKLVDLSMLLLCSDKKISPIAVEQATNLSDWILMCALRHPSMQSLREWAGNPDLEIIPTPSKWELFVSEGYARLNEFNTDTKQDNSDIDNALLQFMQERLSYQYPYRERTQIPSKVAASDIAHSKSRMHYAAQKRPDFMQEERLSGTERGTAFHIFMQYADFNQAKSDLETELNRLLSIRQLSKEQYEALNRSHIQEFLQSPLCNRMLKSTFVCREYQFSAYICADEIITGLSQAADEKVILQGAIDCLFEEDGKIVIIDYKTDRVKTMEELVERYAIQLELYKTAVEQSLNKPVSECIIYSLYLNEQIIVFKT